MIKYGLMFLALSQTIAASGWSESIRKTQFQNMLQEAEKEPTFKPQINKKSEQIVKKKRESRLNQLKKEKQMIEKEKQIVEKIDRKTLKTQAFIILAGIAEGKDPKHIARNVLEVMRLIELME